MYHWDENGQLTKLPDDSVTAELVWNWDGKLRSATKGSTTINLKYDMAGNRITKDVNDGQTVTARKYIVDVVGDLPVILMVLDDSQNVLKKYIYANSQIVVQHDVSDDNKLYFYLHDRLGSVRQIIDTTGAVVVMYTYEPFGRTIEQNGSFINPFKFSGQFFDDEIDEYHLRARQYDPYIYRFTSRDPVDGKFEQPMSFHRYLYCFNNPINMIDPLGLDAYLFFDPKGGPSWDPDLGHVTVGVDDTRNGGVIVRSAGYGRLYPSGNYNFLEDAASGTTNNTNIFVTFKNKVGKKGVSSDFRIRSYLQKSIRPYWDTGFPYCSTYAHAALAYGGYDMGFGPGITPKTLMAAAIDRVIGGDANIEVSRNALYWYLTETDWLLRPVWDRRQQFTEAWLYGE